MELTKITALLPKFLDWVSVRKAALLFTTAMLAVLSYTIFDHRSSIFELLVKADVGPVTNVVTVSEKMQAHIKEITDQSADIVVLGVISADLRTNQRFPVYYYSKSALVTQLLEDVRKQLGASQTIFSSIVTSNARMVSVINGEYGCGEVSETLMAKVVPSLNSQLKDFCMVGLPPYYGDFRGYVIAFTAKPVTNSMSDAIRLETVKLANDVYQEQLNKSISTIKN